MIRLKLLYVVDELPYPERNGVTIPSLNILKGINELFEVSILYLVNSNFTPKPEQVKKNKEYCSNIWIVKTQSFNLASAILQETLGIKAIFQQGNLNSFPQSLLEYSPDIIWGTPIGGFSRAIEVSSFLKKDVKKQIFIAAISDSYVGTLNQAKKQVLGRNRSFKSRMVNLLKYARSFPMRPIERRLLRKADLTIVQTKNDQRWVKNVTGIDESNILVLPNGTNLTVDRNKCESNCNYTIGFIGSLASSTNHKVVIELIQDVLPKLPDKFRLLLLGKDGNEKLMNEISKCSKTSQIKFVETMNEFYHKIDFIVIRNFKNIGLINRTIEAMSYGVVVLGEYGAFNGIDNFESNKHGFVVNNNHEIVEILTQITTDKRQSISKHCCQLIDKEFQWEERMEKLSKKLETYISY